MFARIKWRDMLGSQSANQWSVYFGRSVNRILPIVTRAHRGEAYTGRAFARDERGRHGGRDRRRLRGPRAAVGGGDAPVLAVGRRRGRAAPVRDGGGEIRPVAACRTPDVPPGRVYPVSRRPAADALLARRPRGPAPLVGGERFNTSNTVFSTNVIILAQSPVSQTIFPTPYSPYARTHEKTESRLKTTRELGRACYFYPSARPQRLDCI